MKRFNPVGRTLQFLLVILLLRQAALAQEHWVGTWAAAPQQLRIPAPPAGAAQANPPPTMFKDQTVRMIVRTSLGGRRARVQLSNAFGNTPLTIGAAHVAVRSKESAIQPGTGRALMFNGKPSVTIPVGAQVFSDPVDLQVPQFGDLAISVYVPGESGQLTNHATALHTSYIGNGNLTAAPEMPEAAKRVQWYWISAVDVMASAEAGAIVAFGDSITDGATSTVDADRSWPGVLAQRILNTPGAPKLSVLNLGISGNRLLIDGAGVNALARFDRDVLGQSGVKFLMLMEGINDIGGTTSTRATAGTQPVTADDLIGAMKQMLDKAHTHGIKVIGCTLTPYEGAGYYSEKGEEVRQAVNRWIRTSGAFDAVADFDKVTQDPNKPKSFLPTFNNGDHLHPNDTGYKVMADSVDLSIFGAKKK